MTSQSSLSLLGAVVATLFLLGDARGGILSDMGVVVGNSNTTTYAMRSGQTAAQLNGQNITGTSSFRGDSLYYNIEDQNDDAGVSTFLGPRYGGQDYDAEFLGLALNGTKLSIGILTGQRYDGSGNNPFANFSPGDIRIQTNVGEFWIEVGGSGSGSSDQVITLGENGSTFYLNSSGYTSSASNSTDITAGAVLFNPSVINAVPSFNPAVPVQIDPNTSLTQVRGMADNFTYTFYGSAQQNQHAGIELTLDALSLLGAGTVIQSISWGPSCGNDQVLYLGVDRMVTPEPFSCLIWGGFGMCAGVIAWCHRRFEERVSSVG